MKRLIAASIIFAIVLAACVAGKLIIDRNASQIIILLQQAEQNYMDGEREQAEARCRDAQNKWADIRDVLSMYVLNDELDRIGISLNTLRASLETDDAFRVHLANSVSLLEGLRSSQKISLESIL